MNTQQAVIYRIQELCRQKNYTPKEIATLSNVPQTTLKSILNGGSKNPGTVTIKKLCDGFGITLYDFFSAKVFDEVEQEIK